MNTLIAAICLGTQGTFNEACQKSLDAGTRQVGVRAQVDAVQEKAFLTVENIKSHLTKKGMVIAGAGVFLVSAASNKKLTLEMPTLGICSSAENEIALNEYRLNLKWTF